MSSATAVTKPLTWLHLTDLHVGQPRERDRYENIASALIADLKRLAAADQPDPWHWDLVFFTGDLAFRGSDGEYAEVTARLQPILDVITELNGDHGAPVLLTVPGNHDLARPDPLTIAQVRASWASEEYREAFWRRKNPGLEAILQRAFEGYCRWEAGHPFRRPARTPGGLVPGDFAATVEVRGMRLGVVGLNSAFLHLGDVREGDLDLRLEQLRAVCTNYEAWSGGHDLRILLTHHPVEWLSPAGRLAFEEEIRHGERFDLHLCGHAHVGEHRARPIADGFRHHVQGRSLFGAEEDGHGRLHGYNMGRFVLSEDTRHVDLFLREGWRVDGRGWAFGPLCGGPRRSWFIRAELGPLAAVTEAGTKAGVGPLRTLADEEPVRTPEELAERLQPSAAPPTPLIFLSASVPSGPSDVRPLESDADHIKSERADAIVEAIQALARGARERNLGTLFGGHPSVASALLPVAAETAGDPARPWLVIVQHVCFTWHLHAVTAELARRPGVRIILVDGAATGPDAPSDPTRAALAHMRACMLAAPGLCGGVFVGGKGGVEEEYKLLRALPLGLPAVAVGVGGGAAARILAREPDKARGRLGDSAPLWMDPKLAAGAALDAVVPDHGTKT